MSNETFFRKSAVPHPQQTARWACYAIIFLAITLLGVLNALFFDKQGWFGWITVAFFAPGVFLSLIQILKPAPVTRNRDEFVVRHSSWAAISYLLLCSGWMIGGVLLLKHRPETAWLSFSFSYVCAFGIVLALWQFFDPRPLMVINDRGFYDRTLGMGVVPWSAIEGASITSVQGTDVISLELKDPDALKSMRTVWQQLDSRINQFVGFELMHLGLVRMDALYIDEALDFILARCAAQSEQDRYSELQELQ